MMIKEIEQYAQIRTKARAYLCYILGRNISQSLQNGDINFVLEKVENIQKSLPKSEAIFVLDSNGKQIVNNISKNSAINGIGKGEDRSNRAYYYRTLKEHRCVLTDPYPSLVSNLLVVTTAFPIYDENDKLICIICVDITLKNILRMVHPSSVDSYFGNMSKIVYSAFSFALMAVALLLFIKGVEGFVKFGLDLEAIEINEMFKATILLTLSLAIFDLVKAIFEEEVLGKEKGGHNSNDTHQTMIRFLGSIIIALAIESLMLVFKFALTDPAKLQYAVYLIFGITSLLLGLSVYLKVIRIDEKKQ